MPSLEAFAGQSSNKVVFTAEDTAGLIGVSDTAFARTTKAVTLSPTKISPGGALTVTVAGFTADSGEVSAYNAEFTVTMGTTNGGSDITLTGTSVFPIGADGSGTGTVTVPPKATLLLLIVIALLVFIIYTTTRSDPSEIEKRDSIRDLDKAILRQETTLNDLSKDIQSFQDPLDKLKRYLSGGTLAGKFGEWSLEAIMQDIFHSNQFEKNAEVIKGSGKRVEFVLKMPEGLLLPIDAKFPSGLYDNYLYAINQGDEKLVKKSIDDIRRHVLKDAIDIKEKYIQVGITIDLGVMYIPSEALMQLIDSIDNLREEIFRDSRVLIMGPNSLAAYLISVHMGFRTLALNSRASETMEEFGKLKKEFEKFGSSTDDLLKKADAMLKAVNEHATRERQMHKAIKNMDQLDS